MDRLIFAGRENNRGRASGPAEDGQPSESRPGGLGEKEAIFIATFSARTAGLAIFDGVFHPGNKWAVPLFGPLSLSPFAVLVFKILS